MQSLQKSPRFRFDRPVYDFEALKPRILRAAYAALAKSDETFWKGTTFVTFQGWIGFEVTFPNRFKKPSVVPPLEIYRALNRRAGERCETIPDIFLVKERLKGYLAVKDWVNFHDYLDDYAMLLDESDDERNQYFYSLFVKTAHAFKQVDFPIYSYMKIVDYNSAPIIRKIKLARALDTVWITFEKIKPYLRQDNSIESKLKHINHLIVEFPAEPSIETSIKEIDSLIKDNLDPKTVEWLYAEAQKVSSDKMALVNERSKLVFSNLSDREIYLKLTLIYIKNLDNAERAQNVPYPIIKVKNNREWRVERLRSILEFLNLHLDKYPPRLDEYVTIEKITQLESTITEDREVIAIFKRFISLLIPLAENHPRAHAAAASLKVNITNLKLLDAFQNVISLYKRLS